MLGLRKRGRDRRRRIHRQPTAAEISAMPFEPPDGKYEVADDHFPEPGLQILPQPKRAPARKPPSFKSRFGRSSIVGNPDAKAGETCGFYGCDGTVNNLDGCFTVCAKCGNVEERTRR